MPPLEKLMGAAGALPGTGGAGERVGGGGCSRYCLREFASQWTKENEIDFIMFASFERVE